MCGDSCCGHSCPLPSLPASPSFVMAKRNSRFHKLHRLQTYLSPVLFQISSLPSFLSFIFPASHPFYWVSACSFTHPQSPSFPPPAAKSPFAVIIPFWCFRIIPFTFPVSTSFHADRSPLLFSFLCFSRNSSALAPALPPFVPTLPSFWFFPLAVHTAKQCQEKVYF